MNASQFQKKLLGMENYIVSARKYRPSTFDSVVGQKALTTTLKNAIQNNKLAHAYLFCGPRGVGKTSCARIFAKAINCLNPQSDGEACNECESCKAFNEQRSYNIRELDAASNNSVDDIRMLIEEVRIPPAIGKYKVFIIDEVHMSRRCSFHSSSMICRIIDFSKAFTIALLSVSYASLRLQEMLYIFLPSVTGMRMFSYCPPWFS